MLELESLFILHTHTHTHTHTHIYMFTQSHAINGLRVPETWGWRYMQIVVYMID